jgi:hypothetical protein
MVKTIVEHQQGLNRDLTEVIADIIAYQDGHFRSEGYYNQLKSDELEALIINFPVELKGTCYVHVYWNANLASPYGFVIHVKKFLPIHNVSIHKSIDFGDENRTHDWEVSKLGEVQ